METYFQLGLVLLLGLSVVSANVNLDSFAERFARKFARDCGSQVTWYDLHGRQPHLKEQYPDMKISVHADDIRYGTESRKLDRPGYVYTQWFHNGNSLPITGLVHKEKTVTSTFSWTVTESLHVGTSVEINAGIPEVIKGHVHIESTLNLASTQGKTKTTEDSFKVTHEIHIPPKTKVKAEITITETEVEVPWMATMYVTGHEAIWVDPKCNGHWLWFASVNELAKYNNQLIPGETPYGPGLRFETKGVFRAVRAMRATVHTKEFPL